MMQVHSSRSFPGITSQNGLTLLHEGEERSGSTIARMACTIASGESGSTRMAWLSERNSVNGGWLEAIAGRPEAIALSETLLSSH